MSKVHNQLQRHLRSGMESLTSANRMLEGTSVQEMDSQQLRNLVTQLNQAVMDLTRAEAVKSMQESS